MKCRACNSEMVVDHCESSQHATTCWHQCPLCKHVRLTSDLTSGQESTGERAQLATVAHKDDEGRYPAEPDYQPGNSYLAL